MIVKCTSNVGYDLPTAAFELGYSKETRFPLVVGQLYTVYAMSLWSGHLVCLVIEDGGRPGWNPIDIFSVEDGQLPASWHFRKITGAPVQAVWGYAEIALDADHYDGLIERDRRALAIFEGRKSAMDAEIV